MKNFETNAGSKIRLETSGSAVEFDLYSEEGMQLVCSMYLKLGVKYRWMYEPKWMGIPIIQFPNDVLMMEELVWNLKPDYIVECGVAHGGSCIFYASLLELIGGGGKVIGVDVEIRPHNRTNIENHPMSRRIQLIEGSSTDEAVAGRVRDLTADGKVVLVVLDSNHTHAHVLRELELYSPMVTCGSYIVAMDGAQAYVGDVPGAKSHWADDHPLTAIKDFLQSDERFEMDEHYTRLVVTSSPQGFLKRIK